jgi:ABC-2 type transport system ATP-binding protein
MSQATAIRLENLTKSFGWRKKIDAVKNADLEIAAGQVYGFLGPNGAGKTTTIRMALDLLRPTHGAAYIFDQHVTHNHEVLRRVGSLVEGAAFYPYLSGKRNLDVLAKTHGCWDPVRIQSLLEQVGLAERPKLRFKKYSLGMKQRLGLAAALLHDPDLLIFDEPTNGLDPAGIQEMRTFIRDLVYVHGKTVFLSSHLMGEVEQVCDRVAIINRGEIISEGSVRELLDQSQPGLRVRVTPVDKATQILQEHWTLRPASIQNSDTLILDAQAHDAPQVVRKLVENDLEVYEVTPHKQSLEEFFLKVTGDGNNTKEQSHDNG